MIKLNTLEDLLNIDEKELNKLNSDQLRLMLGVFRFMTRVVEREINSRESLDGNKTIKKI